MSLITREEARAEEMLAEDMGAFFHDPYGWVMYAFPWGEPGPLQNYTGPDKWQVKWLKDWGALIRSRGFDGFNPVEPVRMATSSGHGIGKSALSAMIILYIMSTRPMSKGVVTANTGEQLKTKTWSELAKWHGMCVTGHWFERTATAIAHKGAPAEWRVDAQTCREENSEAFAGLHAATSTPWYLFDEASAIPDKIWEVSRGGLTDGEPMHFAFGNPTRNTGEFRKLFDELAHRWDTRQIDSRDCAMTNKDLIQEWVNDYGEDSNYVRVRVRGVFPRAGDMQFIDSDLVDAAMVRPTGLYMEDEPLIASIDVARGGGDECRLGFRRGFDARSEKSYRITGEESRDSMKVVAKYSVILDRVKPDIIFIDATGIGGPIGDRFRQLGYNVHDVHFGGDADDKTKYANKTAEMGARCEEWLRAGGTIINDAQLKRELISRDFWHDDKDRLVLQRKKDMKKLISVSPDWADQLYLTFAYKAPKLQRSRAEKDRRHAASTSDYDPLDGM